MNTASIESDFLAAKAKTTVTVMNATGWTEGIVNPRALGVDSIFFYVFDHQTKWIWSCSIPKDVFYDVVQRSKNADHSASIACCGQMIAECASANALSQDKENDLAIALTAYFGITKSYQLTERATKAHHFAVIRYGLTSMLRPFAIGSTSRYLIAATAAEDAIRKVIAIDAQNHPEWIAKP